MTAATVPESAAAGARHPPWLAATDALAERGWRACLADRRCGGWLGGALQWHFAGMWLLGLNGLLYLALNLASGRLRRKFFP